MNATLAPLYQKLDEFVRKYYLNRMMKGGLIALLIYVLYFVSILVSEYFAYFSVAVRTTLFYTSLGLFLGVFVWYIFIPLIKYLRIGKVISYKQASKIVGSHFANVQDKLENTLELASELETNEQSNALLLASIEQRIAALRPVPFVAAINFRANRKYMRYLGVLLLIVIPIIAFYPAIITESVHRLVQHGTVFERPAPFTFILKNDTLLLEKGKDFTFKLAVEGDYVPEQMNILIGGNVYLMQKRSRTQYEYAIKNLNNSFDFRFESQGFHSEQYRLQVLPTPAVLSFVVEGKVPAYTNEKDFVLENTGDLSMPAGTRLTWRIATIDADAAAIITNDSIVHQLKRINDYFVYDQQALVSQSYQIVTSNKYFKKASALHYSITVTPDLFPSIDVASQPDSANRFLFYFKGTVKDDYGFSALSFNYYKKNKADSLVRIPIQVSTGVTSQDFFYMFDFTNLAAGDELEYYFEIWDNDGVHRPKSTKSSMFAFKIPSKQELAKIENQTAQSVGTKLEKSQEMSRELKKDIDQIRKKLLDKNVSEWEKTQMMEQMQQKHNELKNFIQDLNKEQQQMNQMLNSFNQPRPDILEKQKELEELMKNVMDKELEKMFDQYKELMKQFDKDKFFDLSQEMKMSYDDLSKQLDKDLQLMKQYAVEKKVDNTIDQLKKLAEEQQKLADEAKEQKDSKEGKTDKPSKNDSETKDEKESKNGRDEKNDKNSNVANDGKDQKNSKSGDTNKESKEGKDSKQSATELQQKQDELKKEFEELSKQYEKAREENKELEHPMDLQNFEKQEQEISKSMQDASEQMQKGNKQKGSKQMQQSGDQMQQMAQQMQQMMDKNKQEQNEENMQDLKQILDNLITYSFEQEAMINTTKQTPYNSPQYPVVTNKQQKLKENFIVIKDSLYALGAREPQIGTQITKEVLEIEKNLQRAVKDLENVNKGQAQIRQQTVMTSVNNLALLLSEVLQQMKQQQNQQSQSQSSGSKSCKNPSKKGQGKPSLQQMKQQQQSMKQQLQQMIDQMKQQGKNGKPQQGKQGQSGMSKELAKMLAQQEVYKQMMGELMNSGSFSPETMQKLNEIRQMMDQNQRDIVNGNITPQTMMRQNQIMTRLLESETAERQREIDQKRESETAKDIPSNKAQNIFMRDSSKTTRFNDILQYNSIKMNNFYKKKYDEYVIEMNK